jgi:hypothetical protein
LHRLTTVLGALTLFPVRLVIAATALVLFAALSVVATLGVRQQDVGVVPMARWRRLVLLPAPLLFRMFVFGLGYNWVVTRGKRAGFDQAPLIVSNHVSIVEASFLAGAYRVRNCLTV